MKNSTTFFNDKVNNIRSSIENKDLRESCEISSFNGPYNCLKLTSLANVTQHEIKAVVRSPSNKHSQLDPIPTWFLKLVIMPPTQLITQLVNCSFKNADVPSLQKMANIRPLQKNSNLSHNVLKNYRPVSNLPYLSKIMKKIVASQLEMHLDSNRLHSPMQSAYRKFHSAETALMMVHNDIVQNLDDGKSTLLLQLDLSAAFDTVDHSILLKRLKDQFGIRDKALKWFASYLSDRYQKVVP